MTQAICCCFLAQFNFTDSKDLVGKLPGDLLLVFGRLAVGRSRKRGF